MGIEVKVSMNIGSETVICTEGVVEGDRMEGGGASFS